RPRKRARPHRIRHPPQQEPDMLPELGHFALILALLLAGLQAFFGIAGPMLGRERWMAAVTPAVAGQCVLVSTAVGCLLASFLRLDPAAPDGRDLNPILQDPALAVHPPILYTGYVGFAVAFAFACAAMLEGKLDQAWARWTRPWTTTAWGFLTCGIALGSFWAYYELGWGGFWFWDPVENASFMPWLVGTALIHSLAVTDKRGLFKSWTLLLAILAFSLSML